MGIDVVVVGSGSVKTAIWDKAEATSPERRIQNLAVAYVRFAQSEPTLYQLMFGYRMADAAPVLARAKATQALIATAVAAGAPTGSDIATRALECRALVHGLSVLLQAGLIAERGEALIERVVLSLV